MAGFEAESDLALDSSRAGGLNVLKTGTLVAGTAVELHNGPATAVISGTAGSRVVTYVFTAMDSTTDSVVDGEFEFVLPVKAKDF